MVASLTSAAIGFVPPLSISTVMGLNVILLRVVGCLRTCHMVWPPQMLNWPHAALAQRFWPSFSAGKAACGARNLPPVFLRPMPRCRCAARRGFSSALKRIFWRNMRNLRRWLRNMTFPTWCSTITCRMRPWPKASALRVLPDRHSKAGAAPRRIWPCCKSCMRDRMRWQRHCQSSPHG